MTFLEGALFGVAGSALSQLIDVKSFREKEKVWPWDASLHGMSIPFFIFGVFTKLIAAFCVVGLLARTNQVSGEWAAAATGLVPDLIVQKVGSALRKEYTVEKPQNENN